MGLAASQARLLTITSRLSSVELKQQQIANSKILLANDSDEVSTKYSTALNNQKIQMKNGQDTVDVNYTTLAAQGYSVKRTSDGVVAKAGSTTTTQTVQLQHLLHLLQLLHHLLEILLKCLMFKNQLAVQNQ